MPSSCIPGAIHLPPLPNPPPLLPLSLSLSAFPPQELWTDGLVRPDDLALPPEAFAHERAVIDETAAAAALLVASGAAPPSAVPRPAAAVPAVAARATAAEEG